MTDIFQIASIGMQDGRQRLEAISQNAANAGLPGYRRHVVAGSSFATIIGSPPGPAAGPAHVNLQRGAMMATGRSLDAAIDADDLFFALTDGEHTWLTRSGAFALNDSGVLVGEGGLRVVGTQGDIHLAGTDVEIGADGRITHRGGESVAALQLFRAADPASLRAARGSLLLAPAGMQPAENAHVRGGMLEASNTDSTREMLGVVALSRQFEALSRVVQSYDELLGRSIEKLGEI